MRHAIQAVSLLATNAGRTGDAGRRLSNQARAAPSAVGGALMEMRLNILKVLNCTLTLLRLRGVSSAVTLFQKGAVSWFLARSPAPSACGGNAGMEGQRVGRAGSCRWLWVPQLQ